MARKWIACVCWVLPKNKKKNDYKIRKTKKKKKNSHKNQYVLVRARVARTSNWFECSGCRWRNKSNHTFSKKSASPSKWKRLDKVILYHRLQSQMMREYKMHRDITVLIITQTTPTPYTVHINECDVRECIRNTKFGD